MSNHNLWRKKKFRVLILIECLTDIGEALLMSFYGEMSKLISQHRNTLFVRSIGFFVKSESRCTQLLFLCC